MIYKPAKLLPISQLSYWHLLSKLLIVWAITACSDKSSYGPLIIESPDFHQVQEYTNIIRITFNIYPPSGGNEAIYHCPFYWAEGTKLIPGSCPSIPTGTYAYQLEYREKSNNLLLAKAEGTVNIDKTQGAVIAPNLGFNFDENQDGKNNLDDFLCRMKPNTPPIAKAGVDLSVKVDDLVKLNGGDSSDADCNNPELKYLWTLTRPTNSSATLSDNEVIAPSFTPDMAGNYEITLVVNDGSVDSVADAMTVTATTQVEANSNDDNPPPKNNPPIANAGDDQTSEVGQSVTLDGSGSYDPDAGDQINYLWSSLTDITLSSTTEAKPTFTIADQIKAGTVYRFGLTVNDDKGGESATDEMVVTVINSTPEANAGVDQSGKVGDVVTLDGRGSTDANGDELSYLWTLTDPDGKAVDLTNATSTTPGFTPTVAGNYQASLVVNDGVADSKIHRVTIAVTETSNQKPIANAGIDQKAQVGDNITLDGSNSSDADDDSLTYQWTPPSGLSLENASAVKPALTIPTNTVAGTLTFSLVVEDSKGEKSDSDTVQITIINSVPEAQAGVDQNAEVDDFIELDASASRDPNGDDLTYSWTTPKGIVLSDNKVAKPSFIISIGTKAGTLSFSVTVNDGHGGTATDNVDIHVLNTAPKANAGIDRSLSLGETLTLDGQTSSDMNLDDLTYQWQLSSTPPTSGATINNAAHIKASFTPDVVGNYDIELQVSDGLAKGSDLLSIIVEQDKPQMIMIPAGFFQMGDESSADGINQGSGDNDEVPVHQVRITAFEMGQYEVTSDEYDKYLVSRSIDITNITGGEAHDNGWGRGNRPVINVSWDDIQGYLDWLNSQLGIALDDPKRYRLPSEAEWEYAARAGTITTYSTGDCIDTSQANYNGEFGYSYNKKDGTAVDCLKTDLNQNKTLPVGSFPANDFGLHDMHGNVWEWVEDCLHDNYTGAPDDGTTWVSNCADSRRILRGGAWDGQPMTLRSSNRGRDAAINRRNFIGFRLARSI